MRSPPSPHQYTSSPHLYAAHVEYGAPHPGVHPGTPGAIYGSLGPHAMHFYNQGTQFSRRRDAGDAIALRSPILEEFRTNRSRKWELGVSTSYHTLVEFDLHTIHRTFMVISWSLVVTSMVHDLFSKRLKVLQAKRSK